MHKQKEEGERKKNTDGDGKGFLLYFYALID